MATVAQELALAAADLAAGFAPQVDPSRLEPGSDATGTPAELVEVAPGTLVMSDRVPSADDVAAFQKRFGGVLSTLADLPKVRVGDDEHELTPGAVAALLPYAQNPDLAGVRLPGVFTNTAEMRIVAPVAGDEHWATQEQVWTQAPKLTTLALGELAAAFVPSAKFEIAEGKKVGPITKAARFLVERAQGGTHVRTTSLRARAKKFVDERPLREVAEAFEFGQEVVIDGHYAMGAQLARSMARENRAWRRQVRAQRAERNAAYDNRAWRQYADAEARVGSKRRTA